MPQSEEYSQHVKHVLQSPHKGQSESLYVMQAGHSENVQFEYFHRHLGKNRHRLKPINMLHLQLRIAVRFQQDQSFHE